MACRYAASSVITVLLTYSHVSSDCNQVLFHFTNPAVEQSKIVRCSKSPRNQSDKKGKGLWRKGFAEEPSLEFRMKY